MKIIKILFFMMLNLAVPMINGGFSRSAGRLAQAVTRGSLIAIPASMAGGLAFLKKTILDNAEPAAIQAAINTSNLGEKETATLKILKKEISDDILIPVQNITINPSFDLGHENASPLPYKNSKGENALILTISPHLLQKYLENPKKARTILHHELAHVTNKTFDSNFMVAIGSSTTMLGIGTYLATRKIAPRTLPTLKLFKHALSHSGKLLSMLVASAYIFMQHSQFHEKKADAMSIQKTKNIEELNYFKEYLESTKPLYYRIMSNSLLQAFSPHPTPESRISHVENRIKELKS